MVRALPPKQRSSLVLCLSAAARASTMVEAGGQRSIAANEPSLLTSSEKMIRWVRCVHFSVSAC